jgi:hypothetical protein
MRSLGTFVTYLAVIAATSVAAASAGKAEPAPTQSLTISMKELNGSGQNGTATLTAVGDKVSISVHLNGEPATAVEPAHVHFGHCPAIKAVPAYNVGPIVGGTATRVVDLTWSEIISGKYVLNVHESAAMLGKYMSCGNIGNSAELPLPTEDSGY